MSPDTRIDSRFDEIVAQLRAATPSIPERPRAEILAVAVAAPAPRPTLRERISLGRAAVVAAGAAATVLVGVAAVQGLATAIDPPGRAEGGGAAEARSPYAIPEDQPERAQVGAASSDAPSAGVAPSRNRAQDFHANVRLLVDDTEDLSATTQEVLRRTRRFGGYVVSVEYVTPRPGDGSAALRLRIPVSRVQAAIVQFSDLGRILAQETRITDLQQPLDELTRSIRRLEQRIGDLRARLAQPNLPAAERERLTAELAAARAQVASLRERRTEVNRRAAFATVALALTTEDPQQQPATPGRLDRAVDDALRVLAAELAIGAYVLIVAAPFLLLAAAALFGNRAYRRHADQRLLERA